MPYCPKSEQESQGRILSQQRLSLPPCTWGPEAEEVWGGTAKGQPLVDWCVPTTRGSLAHRPPGNAVPDSPLWHGP